MELETSLPLSRLTTSVNIAEDLSVRDRSVIAQAVYADWLMDKMARQPWEERQADALKLALQLAEVKTFPWPNCANVMFPLITVAALQFHARAYTALLPGGDVVKCRTYGEDPDGVISARASRIAAHLTYQILEEDVGWEECHDKVLLTVAIVGCAFKKIYFDPSSEMVVSEFVPAQDIYVPYNAKSLELASRITHIIRPSHNRMVENERRGYYLEGSCEQPPRQTLSEELLEQIKDRAQGVDISINDLDAPFELLEQHCWLDLDGDGYKEPYVVTVRADTAQLCRIVARYTNSSITKRNGKVVQIVARNHFQKYSFIPSPDGGFYDIGWGFLLGPLNESINTTINQLLDAGTLNTTGGGFIGRGARLRSGDNTFKPFEWKRVDNTGDDLRKNLVPLAVKDPSQVLFSLLQLLINYGERIASVTEAQVGEYPGQNTPAETTRTVVAEGQRVLGGILKRLYRSMKQEFRTRFTFNRLYMAGNEQKFYAVNGNSAGIVLAEDYSLVDVRAICPAADPAMLSDGQAFQQVTFLKQSAQTTPGYDVPAVERRLLQTLRISNISEIYPGPDKIPAPANIKLEIAKMQSEERMQLGRMKMQMAALQLMGEADLTVAKIEELKARATLQLSQAQGVDAGHQLALINTQIGAAKAHQEGLLKAAKMLQDHLQLTSNGEKDVTDEVNSYRAGVERVAPAPSNPSLPAMPTGGAGTPA